MSIPDLKIPDNVYMEKEKIYSVEETASFNFWKRNVQEEIAFVINHASDMPVLTDMLGRGVLWSEMEAIVRKYC